MAPNISVPANFGKHHLNSRSHNNLELLCAEGETLRANSMIMSLNCRVIDDLITRLEITSLDMQDFSAPAVKSFVDSMYSGELEDCDKSKFRELNKMGRVIDVNWYVERCNEYFIDLVKDLNVCSYQDIKYVVEEARYAEEELKEDKFTALILKKLDVMKGKKSIFLKEYAKNLGCITMSQLEMVIKLAGKDVGILVSILVNHLEACKCSLETEITQNLFEKIDFVQTSASTRYTRMTDELFDILYLDRNDKGPEFRCVVSSFYKSINKESSKKNLSKPEKSVIAKYPVIVEMPAREFLKLDWDSLLEYLSQCSEVNSLTLVFDAVYTWLWGVVNTADKISYPRIKRTDCDDFIKDILDTVQDRGWNKVSQKYLQNISKSRSSRNTLVDMFLNSDQLSVNDNNQCFMFTSSEEVTFLDLFTRNLKITLVAENNLLSCDKDTKCAVLLETSSQLFGLMFATHVPESDTEDIHYHNAGEECEEACLLLTNVTRGTCYPLPFNFPLSYVSENNWHWGYFFACNENRKSLLTLTPPILTLPTRVRDNIRITAFLNVRQTGSCK